MPLSEHEQRQLEQIEQALYAEYPKLAQSVRSHDPRIHYRRRILAAGIGFLVGVGLLLGGVVSQIIPTAVGGFVVMLACAMWALTSWRHMGGALTGRAHGDRRSTGARGQGGVRGPRGRASVRSRRSRVARQNFMERLEERWRRRQEGGL